VSFVAPAIATVAIVTPSLAVFMPSVTVTVVVVVPMAISPVDPLSLPLRPLAVFGAALRMTLVIALAVVAIHPVVRHHVIGGSATAGRRPRQRAATAARPFARALQLESRLLRLLL
jgi:hypothetical protein